MPYSLFTEFDINLFRAGKHFKLYEKFGSHPVEHEGQRGIYFAVYAPAAWKVQVIGNFNFWNGEVHNLYVRWDGSGIWEGFIPGLDHSEVYKYRIYSHHDDKIRDKADPYAFHTEQMPKSASVVWPLSYKWKDKKWMTKRKKSNAINSPISVYELHIGSWRKKGGKSLSYREIADELVDYINKMQFTHVEFMPLTEHPYYPSWGYLSTSYFAPTSRFGTPEELMHLLDKLHQNDIGVLIDWVPAHFPSDDFALADFDGSALYEHPDKKKGFHPDWNSLIFNFERAEIRSFLISSAHFWFEKYHVDGLRVDAVSSMLYLDYSRNEGEWEPNMFGGNEYLAAIDFIKELNASVYGAFDGILMIAEESTAFPGVTNPVHLGGLGFGLKWMMGWMNDTLQYISRNPIHRKYHHNEISFSMAYAYSENYILPLSHDEVVHGKNSLIYKLPGDEWQRFANLRLLYGYMYTHPGHKLLFMGGEYGETSEWNVNEGLNWHLLNYEPHQGIQNMVIDLNSMYKKEGAMSQYSFDPKGFEWIDHSDHQNCVLAYMRKSDKDNMVVVCNFTPNVHKRYRIGVPNKSSWKEIFNSDSKKYWGSDIGNRSLLKSVQEPSHGREHSIELVLPPLACIILKEKKRD